MFYNFVQNVFLWVLGFADYSLYLIYFLAFHLDFRFFLKFTDFSLIHTANRRMLFSFPIIHAVGRVEGACSDPVVIVHWCEARGVRSKTGLGRGILARLEVAPVL